MRLVKKLIKTKIYVILGLISVLIYAVCALLEETMPVGTAICNNDTKHTFIDSAVRLTFSLSICLEVQYPHCFSTPTKAVLVLKIANPKRNLNFFSREAAACLCPSCTAQHMYRTVYHTLMQCKPNRDTGTSATHHPSVLMSALSCTPQEVPPFVTAAKKVKDVPAAHPVLL